jgi:hypothetical protein
LYKTTLTMTIATLLTAASPGWSQAQPQAPPTAPGTPQLNLQVLAEALRTAATFHDLVKNLDVEKNLKLDASAGSGQSLDRTAAILGAGAGAGAAIGELKGGQKAVLIGVAAGAAGALVLDQVLRHKSAKPEAQPAAGSQFAPEPKKFETRPRNPAPERPSQN